MPVLASLLLKRVDEKEPFLFRVAERVYNPFRERIVRKPVRVCVSAAVVFFASLILVPFRGA